MNKLFFFFSVFLTRVPILILLCPNFGRRSFIYIVCGERVVAQIACVLCIFFFFNVVSCSFQRRDGACGATAIDHDRYWATRGRRRRVEKGDRRRGICMRDFGGAVCVLKISVGVYLGSFISINIYLSLWTNRSKLFKQLSRMKITLI